MTGNRKMKIAMTLLIVFLFFCASLAHAAVPGQISYQGMLTDDFAAPLNGVYSMRFYLYSALTGGTLLWDEQQNVVVTDGVYNVQLGSVNPLDAIIFLGTGVNLEVAIYNADTSSWETLSPRQRITSTAFAFKAADADTLEGKTVGQILGSTDGDGLRVEAAANGVNVVSAGTDGMYVYSAGSRGVSVFEAGDDGIRVFKAGNVTGTISSTYKNGLEVAGAEGNGLYVGRADRDGVQVNSAGRYGVLVGSVVDDGVHVYSAGDDGVYVNSAGSPTTTNSSSYHNGIEVAGAEGHGFYVGRADFNGLRVNSASNSGVHVNMAGGSGFYVTKASKDGVLVNTAGNPDTVYHSPDYNGIEVAGAEGHGFYVGRANQDGVYVYSAGDDGVLVNRAGSPSAHHVSTLRNGFEVGGAEGDGLRVGHADRYGVHVNSAGNKAGYFNGDVVITGNLSKGGGSFTIDHPLDPENKYLNHSFVESPDMMNVYNGNVVLDYQGEAWVELPEYFESLNKDFRYQLTCIGGFAQVYIAEEVSDNRFKIAGGTPGIKVSWQVTGIRRDPYAEANRIVVEEEKPQEEQGTYLHPEAYGMPETMGLRYKEAQVHLAIQEVGNERAQ